MIQQDGQHNSQPNQVLSVFGLFLVVVGVVILISSFFKTGWLMFMIVPAAGSAFTAGGIRSRRMGWIIAGSILLGLGIGAFLAFGAGVSLGLAQQIGIVLMTFATSWLFIYAFSLFRAVRAAWWALFPAEMVFALGACFYFSQLRLLDFVLYMVTALGIALLVPGVFFRLFGLIIAGSIVVSMGPGVYAAWATGGDLNALTRTGMMLVIFALGWGLITLGSRVITDKFVWWPLIPGGVLAMTGWGLYIGGNPGEALSFIGNTGSVGLIILGMYLLLLRRGIHR